VGIPITPGGNAPNPAVADPPAPPAAPPPGGPKNAYWARNWDGKSELEAHQGTVSAGAVAGGAGIKAPNQAQARREAQKLYNEVSAAKENAQARIDALRARREEVTQQLEDVHRRIAELEASKPEGQLKGNDPWVQQLSDLERQKAALEKSSHSLNRQIAKIQSEPLSVEGANVTPGKVGPVGAVVVDNTTGQVFRAVNGEAPPAPLAQVLQEQLASLAQGAHPSLPGSHAEVLALNQAILAREARTGRPVTAGELSSFTLDTVWLDGRADHANGMTSGLPAQRCGNCAHITEGVENMGGDAPSQTRWAAQDRDAAKGGGVGGAMVGFGFGVIDAVKTGHVHPGKIMASTAVGAGAGMVGAVVQQHAGRAFDRVVGRTVERGVSNLAGRVTSTEVANGVGTTARVLGGRLAGAGIAGAVVSAGFATVDQIGKYRRGEVTGSQAVGNVAGEAAVGMGAGLAGAAAGAAIGSVIPIAGTAVGAVVGFAVGCVAGYLADKGLRGLGVDKAVAHAVTGAIDAGSKLVHEAGAGIAHAATSLWHALGW
jgi:hypothetical protein